MFGVGLAKRELVKHTVFCIPVTNNEPLIQWLSFVGCVTYVFSLLFVHELGRYFSRFNCFTFFF